MYTLPKEHLNGFHHFNIRETDDNELELVNIRVKVKGSFAAIWDSLVQYCVDNKISKIKLTDSSTTDRDVWGEKYGFHGTMRRGTRYFYTCSHKVDIDIPLHELNKLFYFMDSFASWELDEDELWDEVKNKVSRDIFDLYIKNV